jgi:hypothetical protein
MKCLKMNFSFDEIIETVRQIDRTILFNDIYNIKFIVHVEDFTNNSLAKDSNSDCSIKKTVYIETTNTHLDNTLYESTILTNSHLVKTLLYICRFTDAEKWKHLYRGTRDGFCSEFFHRHCDNIPNTLTIIKAKDGSIFGGFSSLCWDKHSGSKYAQKAFIFSLVNKENKPTKFDYTGKGRSIYCSSGYGPTFGGGCDLPNFFIASNSNENKRSYSKLGTSYQYTLSNNSSLRKKESAKVFDSDFLTGSFQFQVSEIEVFALI